MKGFWYNEHHFYSMLTLTLTFYLTLLPKVTGYSIKISLLMRRKATRERGDYNYKGDVLLNKN